MAQELTIVSVYHNRLSKRLLELNGEFTRALNRSADFKWLVGDNTPRDFQDKIDGKTFTVIPNPEDHHGLGSHQHATAVNKCLKEVRTRFVLSLDSDFYIVRNEWITDVLAYMKANDLAFFGVTYHAQDYAKYRYFPWVACIFIDLQKVPADTIDFMPQIELTQTGQVIRKEKDETKKKTLRKKIKRFLPAGIAVFAAKIMRTLSIRRRRMAIGTGNDTSYRIYARYGNDKRFRRSFATVVFDPANKFIKGRVWLPLNRLFEALLPDRLCYIPKNKDSYTTTGFNDIGYADLKGFGWEEYLWQGKPFSTHIRGSKTWKRNESEDDEVASIKKALETFIEKEE